MVKLALKHKGLRVAVQMSSASEEKNSSSSESACLGRVKPRALVFKASDRDLDRLKVLIREQFAGVEIIYVTSGPASCILHVTKSMPFEKQDSSTQPLYTIE